MSNWVDKMELAAEKTVDFASAEIPEYIKELLAWEFCSCLFGAFVAVVVMLVSVVTIVKSGKILKSHDWNGDAKPGVTIIFICGLMFGVGSVPIFFERSYHAIKVKVAPRVVLVEKIQELAKGKK